MFFCVLHIFQNFPCTLGEKSKSVSFLRVYVCVKAKLTLVNIFLLFFMHLPLIDFSAVFLCISHFVLAPGTRGTNPQNKSQISLHCKKFGVFIEEKTVLRISCLLTFKFKEAFLLHLLLPSADQPYNWFIDCMSNIKFPFPRFRSRRFGDIGFDLTPNMKCS